MKGSSIKMERQSPVHLPGKPKKTQTRNHWPIVSEYAHEGPGPWAIDLSHCSRWDIQGPQLDQLVPKRLFLPAMPGTITLAGGVLLGRTGLRQTFMWIFDGSTPPLGAGCTETTEGTFCIALLGKDVLKITEKLTILDPGDPKHKTPFLLLGPFSHVTSHLIVLKNDPADAVVLIAGSRGFAHDMVHDILAAGEEWGLRPAGEMKFQEMLKSVAA